MTEPMFRAVTWDLETSNLKSDLGMLLCAAFLDMHTGKIISKDIDGFDGARSEKKLIRWVREQVVAADLLIGQNSVAFDKHFVDGVLTRHRLPTLPKRLHLDTLQTARYGWGGIPSSYSLRNLSNFFHLTEEKESLGKDYWREALADAKAMRALRLHCEADCRVTALLWRELRQHHYDWRGR